ncbi:MAG: hypothetical protein GY832_21505 [Chloroflexi bacterium]|nr:hypothetical protein [Chloroflexota bacterium]
MPDRAKLGRLTCINTGTWTNVIAPLSTVTPPTRTYAHDAYPEACPEACPELAEGLVKGHGRRGHARLLQWTDNGPVEPILIRRD